jgi:hypothetical protein
VERKDTGAIIACSEAGIITNGQGKKMWWWIPSDGYKLISSADKNHRIITFSTNAKRHI